MDSLALVAHLPVGARAVPLVPTTKRPLMPWRNKTLPIGEVAARLRAGAGLAIIPHSIGMLEIDSDIRGKAVESDEVFARADSALGEPAGWCGTPGGGRHLWYRSSTPFASMPLKLAGVHVGEIRSAGVLVTVHDPPMLGRLLGCFEDCRDVSDRVPAFLALFDPPPAREPRPPTPERRDFDPITLDAWRAALPDLKRAGGLWQGPCPLCGGVDRFRVLPDGRAFCRQCLPDNGNRPRFRELVRTVFGETRDE